ncbi:MAG TPA: sugar transferase [Candidatus Acidoferrales bacterium]|nr:sugar transferase [Candidatus Acidoferrales bacterium]
MATKFAEIQSSQDTLKQITAQAKYAARAEWLSRLLKKGALMRSISLCADALALLAAYKAAIWIVVVSIQIPTANLSPRYYVLFYLPFLLSFLFLFDRDQRSELRRPERELELTVKGVSLAFLLLVCANFVLFRSGISRYLMVSWYVLALVALLAVRHCRRMAHSWLWTREIARRRTLLVGSSEKLFQLQTLLSIQRYRGYELLGIVPAENNFAQFAESRGLPVLGSLDHWQEVVQSCGAEQVIVAFDGAETRGLRSDLLTRCLADRIDVQVYSGLFASRAFNYELDEFSGFFRFFAAPRWSKQVQVAAKRVLDFAAGVVGSLLTALLLPIVALLIKCESRGPIFYRSAYVGPDGENRHYLKFRTMRVDADEILESDSDFRKQFAESCKVKQDPRVTRIGRFLRKYSVDELPSFFSILRGRISLVGPRTIMQMQKEKYGPALPKLLSVQPGLTGFWQVMGRQLTTHEERVQMDMFYIDHWSIWLDLWIIAKTFWKVIRADGAY